MFLLKVNSDLQETLNDFRFFNVNQYPLLYKQYKDSEFALKINQQVLRCITIKLMKLIFKNEDLKKGEMRSILNSKLI